MPIRRIAHLDMDAFFASVELLQYPELRGQAVVVGGRNTQQPVVQPDGEKVFARLKDYVGRGVITTSTYEARALGVFSGMGLMKSARLAPEAILLPANFDAYRHYSRLFKSAVVAIAPRIEDRGIDEIYIDLSDIPEESETLGQRLKQAVFDATGLTCSIGITPNKLLSKIASDLDKPNGLTILTEADIQSRIWPLPAKKVNGIGPKAAERLTRLGIQTIGELAPVPVESLVRYFGQTTGLGCIVLPRVSMSGRWSPVEHRNQSAARAPSSATCMPRPTAPSYLKSLPHCACASLRTWRARDTPAGPSASSCATQISRR